MSAAPRLGAVVLAAGAGRRMGGVAKALLREGSGPTFLARIVATAGEVGVAAEDVVVVVGPPFADAVAAAARALGAAVAINPEPERGMASSVAAGFAAIAARAVDAAFLWPVDHPRVAAATVRALADAGEGVPRFGDHGGHPPLVPRRLFDALAGGAATPGGARDHLRALPRITVADRGVIADLDEPADLEAP